MNTLELFAGIGGMSLGLERAGMPVVGQVEIDPFCRKVLDKHWPEVPKHDDVRTAIDWWLSEPRPRVDVVAGGYPCQGESQAGRRKGTEDDRWLWPEMARVIYALRPRWVIAENVQGHRTKGLRFVLRDLERLGYAACAGTIRACDLGAPHQRTRIFTIATNAFGSELWEQPWWLSGSSREGATEPGSDGDQESMADADVEAWRPEAGDAESGARSEAVRGGSSQPGRRGSDVADSDSSGRDQQPRAGSECAGCSESSDRGAAVADSTSDGRRARRPRGSSRCGPDGQGLSELAVEGERELPNPDKSRLEVAEQERELPGPAPECGWWTVEPDVGRVAHGIPNRVDRLRALGNAVVPQCAERIGRIAMDADRKLTEVAV